METNFSDADISSFLKSLIELGGGNVVDDSPDKYIRLKSTGKQETLTIDGRSQPLAIYGTRATDAIIINPFAEGEADSTKNTWFYASRNIVLSAILASIMKKLLTIGAENANRKKGEKETADMKAIGLLSKHILSVDEKMVKEFESLSKELHNFFNIYYNKTTRQGEVKCVIFVEAQRKAFPSIRVKTWDVLAGLMRDILNVTDLSEFNYMPQTLGVPVFESFANILVNIYARLEEPMKLIDRTVDNLAALRSHLKYLPQYYGKAKWCTAPQPAVGANMGMASPLVMPAPMGGNYVMPNQMPGMLPAGAAGVMPGVMPGMMNGMVMPYANPVMPMPAGTMMPGMVNTTVPMMPMPAGSAYGPMAVAPIGTLAPTQNDKLSPSANPFARA